MRIYIAGAWVEQHQRARPMIAKVREAGLFVTHDWTQVEGDVCACGYSRRQHAGAGDDPGAFTGCSSFNGIGVGSDAKLSAQDRARHAVADLHGVLTADLVWLLAPDTQGACGSWVELGAALAVRSKVIVSGRKSDRTIFTELTDCRFLHDSQALAHILWLSTQTYQVEPLATGWYCASCGVFNGDAKEFRITCRSCDSQRPK